MVKTKEHSYLLTDGSIDLNAWLAHLADHHHDMGDLALIRNAAFLSQLAGQDQATESGESCLQQGLAMADILTHLNCDQETLAAAILYESVQYSELTPDDIQEQLSTSVAKLIKTTERMSAIDNLSSRHHKTHAQLENIRKMLIAMVDDIRAVLIKLAERLRILRTCSHMPETYRKHLALETMNIFAPLANRLGLGQLKWEMEDLAFRYLDPQKYKEIANGLKVRRVERDQYVKHITMQLQHAINEMNIEHANVYGRSKHIHSIYKKMQRKNVDIDHIYDATALRVHVNNIEECYTVLSIVHGLWERIPEEFDDYIANPKSNGYQSLHTAVIGPQGRVFEVQIRTHNMHELAERGIAAHWLYKEGGDLKQASHERKIEWLLEILDWQREVAHQDRTSTDIDTEFLDDRVYIFTPKGDVIDLPKGSTPLDFAYHIHSQVGHCCRGAKVDGKMVPLTHNVKTGEQVEILTSKEPRPSRDWMNTNLGYLKSTRARAKVHQWFKSQDFDKNREAGQQMLERETRKLHIKNPDLDELTKQFHLKTKEDFFAALGRGDLRLGQVINQLKHKIPSSIETESSDETLPKPIFKQEISKGISIEGVGNLLTHIAQCCQPIPGDQIVGYITIGRGISVHRHDCNNVLHASETQQERFISVDWSAHEMEYYPVEIDLHATVTDNLERDVTHLLTQERITVKDSHLTINKTDSSSHLKLMIRINNLAQLSRIMDKLGHLPNVHSVKRIS